MKDTSAQAEQIYRKGNLIKNDLRIRAEVLNDFVLVLAYFAHIHIHSLTSW